MATATLTATGTPSARVLGALYEAEDRHFWFRSRNQILAAVVRRLVAGLPAGYRVLEAGCGNGNVLRVLEAECRGGSVVGLESSPERARLARSRVRCPVLEGDLHFPPGPARGEAPFDLVGLFDVLEHLPDEGAALAALRGALGPGGRLILTVPAWQALWGPADVYAGHFRRYSPATLRSALRGAGLVVERLTPFLAALLPLMWLSRRDGEAGEEQALRELRVRPVLDGVLGAALRWEAGVLARGWGLPTGTSLLAVARREDAE